MFIWPWLRWHKRFVKRNRHVHDSLAEGVLLYGFVMCHFDPFLIQKPSRFDFKIQLRLGWWATTWWNGKSKPRHWRGVDQTSHWLVKKRRQIKQKLQHELNKRFELKSINDANSIMAHPSATFEVMSGGHCPHLLYGVEEGSRRRSLRMKRVLPTVYSAW